MPFGNKDLLMKLLPHSADHIDRHCKQDTHVCFQPTVCAECTGPATGCGPQSMCAPDSFCAPPTMTCIVISRPTIVKDMNDLAELRAELTETLRHLEEIERDGLPSPITKSQVDEMERQAQLRLLQARKMRKDLDK